MNSKRILLSLVLISLVIVGTSYAVDSYKSPNKGFFDKLHEVFFGTSQIRTTGMATGDITSGQIESFSMNKTSYQVGETTTFTIAVRNTGTTTWNGLGPESGTTYLQSQSYNSLGYKSYGGRTRVGIDVNGVRLYIWRWNTGNLVSQEISSITGNVKWETAGTYKLCAGVVNELVAWMDENKFCKTITVSSPIITADIKANNYDTPKSVLYNSTFNVSWTSTETTYCAAFGHHVPLVEGGLWTDLKNLPTSGSKSLYARHQTSGYMSSLEISIQCLDASGQSVEDTVSVPVSPVVTDTTPTTVSVYVSPEKPVYGQKVDVYAVATDNYLLGNTKIYIDGALVNTCDYTKMAISSADCHSDQYNMSIGTHTAFAIATDNSGNVGKSSTISFTIVSETIDTCTDSDGGLNFYVKGYAIGLDSYGNPNTRIDDTCYLRYPSGGGADVFECDSGKNCALEEAICSGQYVASYSPGGNGVDCPYGCKDGACLQQSSGKAPVITGIGGPSSLKVGETGKWTVSAYDPEQGPLSYAVLWGDEKMGAPSKTPTSTGTQTATFTHIYYTAGTFSPTFIVTDNQGLSAESSISVNVGGTGINNPPKIGPVAIPYEVKVGDLIEFYFTASDPDNDYLSWSIGWGDGQAEVSMCPSSQPNTEYKTTHTWASAGTYTVTVNVNDCRGGSDSTSFSINVISYPAYGWLYADKSSYKINEPIKLTATINGDTSIENANLMFVISRPNGKTEIIKPDIASGTCASSVIKEQVKCVFTGSTEMQKCYSDDGKWGCGGVGSCVTDVEGEKGTMITWKSSCGGYSYTTIDGDNEYAYFSCAGQATCKDSDDGKNYYIKGETYDAYATKPFTDTCQNEEILTEHWCENERLKGGPYTCLNGCRDGTCLVKCNGVEMVWYTDGKEIRRDPYSYTAERDRCNGYRCLIGNEISPACYNFKECQDACSGGCVDISSAIKQCGSTSGGKDGGTTPVEAQATQMEKTIPSLPRPYGCSITFTGTYTNTNEKGKYTISADVSGTKVEMSPITVSVFDPKDIYPFIVAKDIGDFKFQDVGMGYLGPYEYIENDYGAFYNNSVNKTQVVAIAAKFVSRSYLDEIIKNGLAYGSIRPETINKQTVYVTGDNNVAWTNGNYLVYILAQQMPEAYNSPPKIVGQPAIPDNMKVGQTYTFKWTAVDGDKDMLSWSIDWGDETPGIAIGCTRDLCDEFETSHVWSSAGVYIVTVTVSDGKGGSDTSVLKVGVNSGDMGNRIIVEEPGYYSFRMKWYNSAAATWISAGGGDTGKLSSVAKVGSKSIEIYSEKSIDADSKLLITDGFNKIEVLDYSNINKLPGGKLRIDLNKPLKDDYSEGSKVRTFIKQYHSTYPPVGDDVQLGYFSKGDEISFSHISLWISKVNNRGHNIFGPVYSGDTNYYEVKKVASDKWELTFDEGTKFDTPFNDGNFEVIRTGKSKGGGGKEIIQSAIATTQQSSIATIEAVTAQQEMQQISIHQTKKDIAGISTKTIKIGNTGSKSLAMPVILAYMDKYPSDANSKWAYVTVSTDRYSYGVNEPVQILVSIMADSTSIENITLDSLSVNRPDGTNEKITLSVPGVAVCQVDGGVCTKSYSATYYGTKLAGLYSLSWEMSNLPPGTTLPSATTFIVESQASVQLSTDKSTYMPDESVRINIKVAARPELITGVIIHFITIDRPDGTVDKITEISGGTSMCEVSYPDSKTSMCYQYYDVTYKNADITGTYVASATSSGLPAGTVTEPAKFNVRGISVELPEIQKRVGAVIEPEDLIEIITKVDLLAVKLSRSVGRLQSLIDYYKSVGEETMIVKYTRAHDLLNQAITNTEEIKQIIAEPSVTKDSLADIKDKTKEIKTNIKSAINVLLGR
ncbi:MAG: PKD domain-containing protein [Candidatus Aenigmatarchaeota archaeon]